MFLPLYLLSHESVPHATSCGQLKKSPEIKGNGFHASSICPDLKETS
jgi:hypothetical protein